MAEPKNAVVVRARRVPAPRLPPTFHPPPPFPARHAPQPRAAAPTRLLHAYAHPSAPAPQDFVAGTVGGSCQLAVGHPFGERRRGAGSWGPRRTGTLPATVAACPWTARRHPPSITAVHPLSPLLPPDTIKTKMQTQTLGGAQYSGAFDAVRKA